MPPRLITDTPTHTFLGRDLVVLFLAGVLANSLAARFIAGPRYVDAYYYFDGALQLARGQGFTEPYLWNYLGIDLGLRTLDLPMPSHLYWMPLTSLVAAPFMALAGPSRSNPELFRFAQIPFIALSAALPLLSYLVANLATGVRRHAWTAGLLTLFSAFYFPFWTATDAFALFGLAAGGALLLGAVAAEQRSAWIGLGAGACAGLAHLARADGVLVPIVVIFWMAYRLRDSRSPAGLFREVRGPGGGVVLGYLLIMLPWFIRNMLVAGAPLGTGGTRALWLTEYNDLFNYPASGLTLARYLASGWGVIMRGKWVALTTNFGTLVGPLGNVFVLPFSLVGGWQLRRSRLFQLPALYGLALFAAMTFAFTFPGARGGFFHSGAALLPFMCAAAPFGLETAVDAVARRLKHWQPERSKPIFSALLVAGAGIFTGLLFSVRVLGPDWRHPLSEQTDQVYGQVGAWLARAGDASSIVAVNNPPGFYYFTTHPSIVIPNGQADTLLRAMTGFDARWLVLDVNHPDGLALLYATPESEPRLALRASFTDNSGQPVYLLERR